MGHARDDGGRAPGPRDRCGASEDRAVWTAFLRSLIKRGLRGVRLVISSDMEEVLLLSDRVAVMHEGRVAGVLEREECTESRIMTLAVRSGA